MLEAGLVVCGAVVCDPLPPGPAVPLDEVAVVAPACGEDWDGPALDPEPDGLGCVAELVAAPDELDPGPVEPVTDAEPVAGSDEPLDPPPPGSVTAALVSVAVLLASS